MCLVVILALFIPRTVLFFMWLLTDWCSRVFDGWFWPLMGFFFMPFTTLAYLASMLNNNHSVSGWWAVLLILGILADLTGGVTVKIKE